MRDLSSHVGEGKLSESDQARKDLIELRSRPLQISHTELDDLTQLLGKLEKTESELRSQSSSETRSQIRAEWQGVISNSSDQLDISDRDNNDLRSKKLRLISDRHSQLAHYLRRAIERKPLAMDQLKEIVADYYADQITEKHRLTPYDKAKCKREIDLEPQTHTASGKVRTLDIVLVADLNKPGLNTGYLGIDTVSKDIAQLLAKLFTDNNISRVRKDHPLLQPNAEGGYTSEQLQIILTKLQAYQATKIAKGK